MCLKSTSGLILASESPRRKNLLEDAGLSFSVIPSGFDERSVPLESPENYVKTLAQGKARDVAKRYPYSWVIGADTIVVIDETIIGKPESISEARQMLMRLSGRMHSVYTGYAVCCQSKSRCFSDVVKSEVLFKKLSDQEIDWYISTGEPLDKAGAYAIQGIGAFIVKSIIGSYTNVVGLPVCEVIELLIKEGIAEFCPESGWKN